MSITNLKKQLHTIIDDTSDEDVLHFLKDDYEELKRRQSTDGLKKEDWDELQNQLKEPDGLDTITFEDFKKETTKWLTKSSSKKDL